MLSRVWKIKIISFLLTLYIGYFQLELPDMPSNSTEEKIANVIFELILGLMTYAFSNLVVRISFAVFEFFRDAFSGQKSA